MSGKLNVLTKVAVEFFYLPKPWALFLHILKFQLTQTEEGRCLPRRNSLDDIVYTYFI